MVNYFYWLEKPWETRLKLAEAFELKRVAGTVVENGRVVSDGFSQEEIYKALTIEKMQEFTGSDETNPVKLFDLCVEKVSNIEKKHEGNETAELQHQRTETDERGGDEQKTRGRKKKTASRESE